MKDKDLFPTQIPDKYLGSKPVVVPDKYLGSKLNKNLDFIRIRGEFSKGRLVTNEFGWRINSKKKNIYKSDILLAGASWAEGVCEDWDNTIVGNLEKSLNTSIINIGVGSYSLIQIYRSIKLYIDSIKPKKIIVIYCSEETRDYRYNAAEGLIYRPVYRFVSKDKFKIKEPKLLNKKLLNIASRFTIINKYERTIFQNFVLNILKLYMRIINNIYYTAWKRKKSNKSLQELYSYSLINFVDNLNLLCERFSCNIDVFAMPYASDFQERIKEGNLQFASNPREEEIISYIKNKNYKKLKFHPSKSLTDEFNNIKYFKENSHELYTDHNHPNGKGYKIIAQEILKIYIK